MKKIFLLLIFPLIIFSNNLDKYKWYSFNELYENKEKLNKFDIVVLSPGKEITQKWGHIFLVDSNKKLIEIKGFKEYFVESPIYLFSNVKDRKISILRYKYMNDELEKQLEKLIPKYYNKEYNIISDVKNNEDIRSYCSKFIYSIFNEAGKNIGKDIELTNDKLIIFPFSFFENKDLENIVF